MSSGSTTAEEKKGEALCGGLNRRATHMTVENLYNAILHLVTFGDWTVDPETGTLSAYGRSGGKSDVLKRFVSKPRTIHIFGFTNKDIDPTGVKVYTNLLTLQEDINKYYTMWRSQALLPSEQKLPADFIQRYLSEFLKNALSAVYIPQWQLIRIRKLIPRHWEVGTNPANPSVSGTDYKYDLTFIGDKGYEFKWRFNPKDIVYFCEYDLSTVAPEEKKMEVYPPKEKKYYCDISVPFAPYKFATYNPVSNKVGSYITTIVDEYVPRGRWISKGGNKWEAKNKYEDGIPIAGIYGYYQGVPIIGSKIGDNGGMYLTEVEEISPRENLWRLRFTHRNRSGIFSTPTTDVYTDINSDLVQCLKG